MSTFSAHGRKFRFVSAIAVAAVVAGIGGCGGNGNGKESMAITQRTWGSVDEKPVQVYTLTNDHGYVAKITNYGGIVTEFHMPDRNGNVEDIVLGFDSLGSYLAGSPYFGAIVGRVANRIAAGRFTLDGETYQLAINNEPNHLHGGEKGWDKVVWDAEPFETSAGESLRLTYHSPDGEEGYPGAVDATVVYTLTHDNELRIEMEATASEENVGGTPVNMVHHSYWNLAGHDSGTIFDHVLHLDCSRYTPTDDTLIPTGELAPVAGGPYDFTEPKPIRQDFTHTPQWGYDLNYVVDDYDDPPTLRRNARITDPSSGRTMEVWSNMPGIQFYGGTFLDGVAGKNGATYDQFTGLCLETQYFPDAVNQRNKPGWPDPVLMPGETYRHTMIHRFSSE